MLPDASCAASFVKYCLNTKKHLQGSYFIPIFVVQQASWLKMMLVNKILGKRRSGRLALFLFNLINYQYATKKIHLA